MKGRGKKNGSALNANQGQPEASGSRFVVLDSVDDKSDHQSPDLDHTLTPNLQFQKPNQKKTKKTINKEPKVGQSPKNASITINNPTTSKDPKTTTRKEPTVTKVLSRKEPLPNNPSAIIKAYSNAFKAIPTLPPPKPTSTPQTHSNPYTQAKSTCHTNDPPEPKSGHEEDENSDDEWKNCEMEDMEHESVSGSEGIDENVQMDS